MFRKIMPVASLARQFVYMYYNWFHKGELRKGDNPYLNKKGSNREIPTLSNHIYEKALLFCLLNTILYYWNYWFNLVLENVAKYL
jgi:hypothetical protein